MFTYQENNIVYDYIDNKKKKTLIYLHGWGQNKEMMEPIATPFAKDNNILLIDLPGFGKSPEPKTAWSLFDYVEMVHELVTSLNIENPILIGHSFGGKISILYASKYDVSKLVLLASPYKVARKKLTLLQRILKKTAKVSFLKGFTNYMKNQIGSTDYKQASELMRQVMVKHINTDVTEECKKIKCPTLIMWGTNDTTLGIENGYELEKLIKDAAVILFENGTHFAYLEYAYKTIRIIQAFIN